MSESRLESLTPDQQEELVAGYVLGDLDPEELSLFQQLLAQDSTVLGEVQRLQETLGAIPYGMALSRPGVGLRSQILQAATPSIPKRQYPWAWGLGGIAIGIAIALGGPWQPRSVIVQHQPSPTDAEVLQASAQFVAGNWQDLDEVVGDHVRSLTRSQGPVDLETQQITEIRSLYAEKMALPKALPQLQTAQLLGGSFCNLNHTKGLRYTYQTASGQTVSLYQLAHSTDVSLPHLNPERLYLSIQQGPNLAIWRDPSFIYLLVSNLSLQDMKSLVVQPSESSFSDNPLPFSSTNPVAAMLP